MSPTRFVCVLLLAIAAAGGIVCFVVLEAAEQPTWQSVPEVQVAIPASAYAAQAEAAAAAAAKTPAATRSFKAALSKAAEQAWKEGKISRWELARLRLAIVCRPQAIAEAQACVIDQACSEGRLASGAAAELDGFDWAQLIAFLKELLPFILQILSVL
jgi:hypothetical protein